MIIYYLYHKQLEIRKLFANPKKETWKPFRNADSPTGSFHRAKPQGIFNNLMRSSWVEDKRFFRRATGSTHPSSAGSSS
jgi:hypothetical protein